MQDNNKRRSFLKNIAIGSVGAAVAPTAVLQAKEAELNVAENDKNEIANNPAKTSQKRKYNGPYKNEHLKRVAFPIGGIGAGMFCIEGTGAISHMSVRNKPDIFNEPPMFAAISVKGMKNGAKVLEGQVPEWKFFGNGEQATGPQVQHSDCQDLRAQNLLQNFLFAPSTLTTLMSHSKFR